MDPDYDSTLKEFKKPRTLRYFLPFEQMLYRFSPGERLVLYILTGLLGLSTLVLLVGANTAISVTVPSQGGTLTEGVIGSARFINPLLTLSQPDEDLTALVYSGLTRALPDGNIVPDLASSYEVSSDGTTYTFTLRPNTKFHDGTPLTAADILFTIQKAQSPDIKSQRRADWEGVAASSPDESTIVFKLPHAYAPFLENTTLGILPKYLWENVSAEEFPFNPLNTHPIGSGPYRVTGFESDATGAATRYDLVPFKDFALGAPYIKKIAFLFFGNEEQLVAAWNAGRIDSFAGISPSRIQELGGADADIVRVALPRIFGIFFNQSKNTVLTEPSVRAALDAAIDKQALVDGVLGGFGVPLEGPIPPGILGATYPAVSLPLLRMQQSSSTNATSTRAAENAKDILARGGWTFDDEAGGWMKKKQMLEFTLATAEGAELSATAQAVALMWRAAGVKVTIHVYPLSELNASIIRPRNYEAVLFGEVVGRTLDLFAFWHSSQRNDPGLNLALYANSRADTLLAQARATTDKKAREKLYGSFAELVAKDQPAVFLYAPEFIYIVPKKLSGVVLGALTAPSERFANVYEWYTDTERVWSFFTNKN